MVVAVNRCSAVVITMIIIITHYENNRSV